jgi:hypothetical protein
LSEVSLKVNEVGRALYCRKEARKAALKAAAEDMRVTGKSENAFPESAYSVGEDHSPNSHSHQVRLFALIFAVVKYLTFRGAFRVHLARHTFCKHTHGRRTHAWSGDAAILMFLDQD